MLESIFATLNSWIVGNIYYAVVGSFLWGIVSVALSPCHLASIPLIIAYVGGQQSLVNPRHAAVYSVMFTTGLFISIALVGIICAMLGRVLGDIGNYWEILIGALLIWVALGMLRAEECSTSSNLLYRLNLRGVFGAFALGVAYGILSGACTFGFIAPILAIIMVQEKIMSGILLIVLFALGHCLPIVAAGSSAAVVNKIIDHSKWQGLSTIFRKCAGVMIILLGIYFITFPFVSE